MNSRTILTRRWRAILDCILILLILLVASAKYLNAQASSAAQASPQQFLAIAPLPADGLDLQSTQTPALPELDNKILAQIIAAENAALTLPLYLSELPFLVR